MTHERPTERLRVDVPTLEPDPAFLGMLAELSATSQAASPRSTRSAGFRMVVATGSVAVIAAATWAAGVPTGGGTPHSPADGPPRIGPTATPSPVDVGTPHSDVTTPPGSPLSPGLPGSSPPASTAEHATDPGSDAEAEPGRSADDRDAKKSKAKGKKAKPQDTAKGTQHGTRDGKRGPRGTGDDVRGPHGWKGGGSQGWPWNGDRNGKGGRNGGADGGSNGGRNGGRDHRDGDRGNGPRWGNGYSGHRGGPTR
ncbi:hypothetical protein [Nocardioides humi]|uniref:Translation initiation factor IF-2 n=1 Tax=Nocardioides humi TaxID=449461 RepID=A0ABN1ZPM0_9ACTN|nr:hypothetical protein [Nocardioides humi]